MTSKRASNRKLRSVSESAGKTTTSFQIPDHWLERCGKEASELGISKTEVYLRAIAAYFNTRDNVSSWETVNPEDDFYDPKRFYTFGEDRKGHSFHVRVNVPKPMAGEVSALVASGRIPEYRSAAHFYRDAIYHRAKQVAGMIENDDLESVADLAILASDEIRIQDEISQVEQLIAAVRTNAQALLNRGDYARLKVYLVSREDISERIPEMFRGEYLEIIEEYYKRIPKGQRGKK